MYYFLTFYTRPFLLSPPRSLFISTQALIQSQSCIFTLSLYHPKTCLSVHIFGHLHGYFGQRPNLGGYLHICRRLLVNGYLSAYSLETLCTQAASLVPLPRERPVHQAVCVHSAAGWRGSCAKVICVTQNQRVNRASR